MCWSQVHTNCFVFFNSKSLTLPVLYLQSHFFPCSSRCLTAFPHLSPKTYVAPVITHHLNYRNLHLSWSVCMCVCAVCVCKLTLQGARERD